VSSHHPDPSRPSSRALPVEGGRGNGRLPEPGERTIRAAELYALVVELASARDLWMLHVPDSRTLARGWPDLVIVSPYGTLFRELKDEEGMLSLDQLYVLKCLKRAGADAGIWRPAQLHDGTIERQLDAIAPWYHGDAVWATGPAYEARSCLECAKTFIPAKAPQKYCTDQCRSRASSRRWREKEAAPSEAAPDPAFTIPWQPAPGPGSR
jgi:hypothetical protein